jgi:hypothetical protein
MNLDKYVSRYITDAMILAFIAKNTYILERKKCILWKSFYLGEPKADGDSMISLTNPNGK